MPINKNAYIRFLAYDKCLRNPGRRYTWMDLRDAANRSLEAQSANSIGKTQFFKDMKVLKGPPWFAPIVSEKSYYRYTDSNYSIINQPLSEIEAEQIKSALVVLSRFKGLPQFEWVHEIIPKIEKNFGLDHRKREIISFDQNIDLKGLEYLGELFNAILYKIALKVQYQSFKSDQPDYQTIHPYYLKQFNNRWFLLGFNSELKSLRNLALDRIMSIEESEELYQENTQYDFAEYFEDMIGVTKPQDAEIQVVKLWFSPGQAPYIDTKPLHGSQKMKLWDENGMIITIEVVPNFELEQLILHFGENCKVLEPVELKDKISSRLQRAGNHYSRN